MNNHLPGRRFFRSPQLSCHNPNEPPTDSNDMTPIRILTSTIAALAVVSCANNKGGGYDTPDPYGPAVDLPTNPVYDTPAAYEESSPSSNYTTAPPQNTTNLPPAISSPRPTVPQTPANGAAMIHTVVAGDTLGGISAKYKVPISAIKQANNMTNDIVVLGRKMVIPPVR